MHDVKAMDEICIEMGAIYLMDKGYIDFFRLLALAKKKMHIVEPSLYMISQTMGTMLFEKIPVRELFNKPNLNVSSDDGQLDLFRDLKS